MLVKIPFDKSSSLLRHADSPKMLRVIASQPSITSGKLAFKSGVSRRLASLFLSNLSRTGHLTKQGRTYFRSEMIGEDYIAINLRDSEADRLFRWRIMRKLLYLLCTGKFSSLAEAARILEASYETVKKAMAIFRSTSIVFREHVNPEFIIEAVDPIRLIPRREHRQVVRHFLDSVEIYYPEFQEPVVLFGDASWGIFTLNIDIAVLMEDTASAVSMLAASEKFVMAAENVTASQGANINLTMMMGSVLIKYNLGLLEGISPTIEAIKDGICVHGEIPNEEDLFSLMASRIPPPNERIEEMLRKGYLEATERGYRFTNKAIDAFKKRPKSKITEKFVTVGKKQIRLIGVAPPT